jgi:hypothetical protein
MRQIRGLLKTGSGSAVAEFYGQHGPLVFERLSEAQRLQLEEIMHWADTAAELEAAAAARSSARRPSGAVTAAPAPVARS